MKTILEQEDIQAIAAAVVERLKPLLIGKVESKVEPIIFDVPGLCAYLNVTSKWVHTRTHLKEIPFIKLSNKQLRFRKKDIDMWLNTLHTPVVEQYRGKLAVVR